ncbi:hypothetical protein N8644_01270 [bacterium]|nr:hypothetical protein [bacterium]
MSVRQLDSNPTARVCGVAGRGSFDNTGRGAPPTSLQFQRDKSCAAFSISDKRAVDVSFARTLSRADTQSSVSSASASNPSVKVEYRSDLLPSASYVSITAHFFKKKAHLKAMVGFK